MLSGTGMDGSMGIREVKSRGGLVLVQSEASADYDGMPKNAIDTGDADGVLLPEQMPAKLTRHFSRYVGVVEKAASDNKNQEEWRKNIFVVLQKEVNHDFSQYKLNTLLRRIGRRMGLHQIDSDEEYLRLLVADRDERQALFREMLIGVTSFFRDPDSFGALQVRAFPKLLDRTGEDDTFRIWVPGCSTGQEVYSLAMIFNECLDTIPKRVRLQIFGTDVDPEAIEKAREGLYPESIADDVSPERLKRFFTREDNRYRIRKDVRERVVFSVQDVLLDPPFSRLHAVCCRNLLIYLKPEAQKKLLPLFHYTLVPGGILVLGSSETIGGFSNLFQTVDKRWKIFSRREVAPAQRQQIRFPHGAFRRKDTEAQEPALVERAGTLAGCVRATLLDRFAPPAVLVDADGNIRYVQGRTGKYLEPANGPPSNNIVDMARPGLRIELSSALRSATSENRSVVRRQVGVRTDGEIQRIDLYVLPQREPEALKGMFLVVFEDPAETPGRPAQGPATAGKNNDDKRIHTLEKELQNTRESHQSTVEELESSNEELKSTNEEVQSSNEELQSTNEELESSKEELQSLNEELQTVNSELQSKVEELSKAHDDMRNLLNSTEIGTVFVDNEMRVKRYTPGAGDIFNLIPTDVGRPLEHLQSNLVHEKLIADLAGVMENLATMEQEVRTRDGKWYNMRIIPYRTTDNRIDGAVLTFVSIDEQKKAQSLAQSVFEANADALAVVDRDRRLVIANRVFRGRLGLGDTDPRGSDLFALRNGVLDGTELRDRLDRAMEKSENFALEGFETTNSGRTRRFSIRGQVLPEEGAPPEQILLSFRQEPASG